MRIQWLRRTTPAIVAMFTPAVAARAQSGVPWPTQDVGIRAFNQADGLRAQSVYAINIAPDGVIWVGTDDQGYQFDGARWIRFTLPAAAS